MGAVQSKQRRRGESSSMHGADSGTGSSFFGLSSNDSHSSSSISTAPSQPHPQPYQQQHQSLHQHQHQHQHSNQPRQRTISTNRNRPLRAGSHNELPTHQQPPVPTRRKTSTSIASLHKRDVQQQPHHHPTLPSIPIPLLNDKHQNHCPQGVLPPSPTKSPPQYKSDSYYTGELQEDSDFLPENWESHDRFFSLHFAVRRLVGDNVTLPVLPKLVKGAHVAEIGCANGPWIMDMATQYPECRFIGLDSIATGVLPSREVRMLPNVHFELVDLSKAEKFPIKSESIDLVSIRALSFRIPYSAWPAILCEIDRILKPGGMVQIIDPHLAPSGTVLIESFIQALRRVTETLGQDYDFSLHIPNMFDKMDYQTLLNKKAAVPLGSSGKLGEEFMAILLRAFEATQHIYGPRLGMTEDDYLQRAEMVCAQCVQNDSTFDWYCYVFQKKLSG